METTNYANIATRDLFSLKDRTILITGGLGGVGSTIIKTILESSGDIICFDLPSQPQPDEAQEFASLGEQHSTKFTYYSVDVTNAASVNSAMQDALRTLRFPLRGVVTAAGISGECSAMDYPTEAFNKIMNVNVLGSLLPIQAAARVMKEQGLGGSIVLIASISGWVTNRGLATTAYNASKAAVLQMTRSLAAEFVNPDLPVHSPSGASTRPIRVNSLSPGHILTPISQEALARQPELKMLNMMGRVSAPAEYRAPVLFLLGDGSSYVTGTDLRVDGGHCAW